MIDELKQYARSPKFKEDLAEASRLIKEGDLEGLARFASRNVEQRAKDAAERIRGESKPEHPAIKTYRRTLTYEVKAVSRDAAAHHLVKMTDGTILLDPRSRLVEDTGVVEIDS